jgi:hypothetical protein
MQAQAAAETNRSRSGRSNRTSRCSTIQSDRRPLLAIRLPCPQGKVLVQLLAETPAYERSRHRRKNVEMLFAHLTRILRLGISAIPAIELLQRIENSFPDLDERCARPH